MTDGSRFTFIHAADQMYRKLQITSLEGESRIIELDYQASGSDIFYVHWGPDEKIYGSSILPLHLFRYDSTEDQLADLGKCSSATGEAYSMANLGNDLYISSYPGASISVYDPFQPYHFGNQPEHNPRDIGRVDDISYRPHLPWPGR